eukprot:m.240832 g.240832  ORF g.240832 m.240832 type:complete len:126 (+) comp23705_c0_seq1:472-849(+)
MASTETSLPSRTELHTETRLRLERYRQCRATAYKSGAMAVLATGCAYYLGGSLLSKKYPWVRQNLFGTSLAVGTVVGMFASFMLGQRCHANYFSDIQQMKEKVRTGSKPTDTTAEGDTAQSTEHS